MNVKSMLVYIVSFIFVGAGYYAAQLYGGKSVMKEAIGETHKEVPSIDMRVPASIETATFAMG